MKRICEQFIRENLSRFRKIVWRGGASHQYFAEHELALMLIGATSCPEKFWDKQLVYDANRVLQALKRERR